MSTGALGLLKAVFTIGFIAILNLTSPSEWVDEELIFKHSFSNQKIILQSKPFEHKQRLVRTIPLTDSLEWLIQVDTTDLNPNKWRKKSY